MLSPANVDITLMEAPNKKADLNGTYKLKDENGYTWSFEHETKSNVSCEYTFGDKQDALHFKKKEMLGTLTTFSPDLPHESRKFKTDIKVQDQQSNSGVIRLFKVSARKAIRSLSQLCNLSPNSC